MIVIGVTGGFGTGKSTVAGLFRQLGAVVLDADVIAHALIAPGKPAWRQTVKLFGKDILNRDRSVDRRKLAAIVFKDSAARKKLEAIIHPRVMRQIISSVRRMRRQGRIKRVVLDVPLLIEAGGNRFSDHLVVVTVKPAVARARLKKKYRITEEEIHARIKAQMALSAKADLADSVVDNSGSFSATKTQVRKIWNQLPIQQAARKRQS